MATNKLLEQAVSDAVTLDVLYKPFFSEDVPTTLDAPETSFGTINVTAIGNPSKIKYTWFRLNEKVKFGKLVRTKRDLAMTHFLQDGAILNATNVTRADAGHYIVQASNSEGETNLTVLVNVQYAPLITKAPKKLYVDAAATATVFCEIDANPLDVSMVQWSRTGYNMSRATPELSGQTAMLKIDAATKEDSGIFTCKVNNGIGDAVEDTAVLLVKHSPEIDLSPAYSKAAAEKFESAALWCKAEGAPDVNFKWYRGTSEVDTSQGKYETTFKQTGIVSFESSLIVHNTTKSDYDRYKCVALNEVGMDERLIQLDGTSRPDPPFELRFVNETHNSVTLTWTAGFDGGSTQRFQVRYKEVPQAEGEATDGKVETYKYEDVFPSSSTLFTIKELKLATSYEITVRGINRLGEGVFQPNVLIARTSAVAPATESSTPDDVPLIIILTVSILGMVLLGLNVLLILFFIRRRRKNKDRGLLSNPPNQSISFTCMIHRSEQ
ncbi:hypothetical protein CAPTEDRAFT_184830 [Capitella teleta]|uniref:Nephrin n=1 Tax=Capitella teleta TaxID=283909 RepID=R7VM35_CAPTE|nr:hypothetical protein CAPTEDRAFT_184830 [Capitella teleta]|eukprot:ELU18150.1 hypothetical protein CAPTEDRAFT_184830 [Capitella teleta]